MSLFFSAGGAVFSAGTVAMGIRVVATPEVLLPWAIETRPQLAASGFRRTTIDRFEAGVEHLWGAVFEADEELTRKASYELALLVEGLGIGSRRDVTIHSGSEYVDWKYGHHRFLAGANFQESDVLMARVEEALRRPNQPSILKRAREWGYAFPFAVRYCLKQTNPVQAARSIEERIDFYRSNLLPPHVQFSGLKPTDKIALFAVGKNNFEQERFLYSEYSAFPPFSIFLRYLEMVLSIPVSEIIPEITKPGSPFLWMASADFYDELREVDSPLAEGIEPYYVHAPYDILYLLYKGKLVPNVPRRLLQRAHQQLVRLREVVKFYARISHAKDLADIESAVNDLQWRDLLKGVVLISGQESSITTSYKVEKFIKNLDKRVKRYSQTLRLTASPDLPPRLEKVAIYLASLKWAESQEWPVSDFPRLDEFEFYLDIEWRRAWIEKRDLSFEELLDSISKMRKGSPHGGTAAEVLLEIVTGRWKVSDNQFLRVHQILLRGRRELNEALVGNIVDRSEKPPSFRPEHVEAALELAEEGHLLQGELFERYSMAPNRRTDLAWVRRGADALKNNADVFDSVGPFEVMAVSLALGERSPPLSVVQRVLTQAEVPSRSDRALHWAFAFPVPLVEPFYNVANKGRLAEYAQEIRAVGTLNGRVRVLKNFVGNKRARQAIRQYLDELETIPDEKILTEEEYQQTLDRVNRIRGEIIKVIARWILDRAGELDGSKKGKQTMGHVEAIEQAVKEVDVYLKNLLIFSLRLVDPSPIDSFENIDHFDKEKSSQEEIYRLLDELSELYRFARPLWESYLGGANFEGMDLGRYEFDGYQFLYAPRHLPPSLRKILDGLDRMNDNRENMKKTGRIESVVLSPLIGKFGAFYGYMSEDSLGTELSALYGMSDPNFVPYRIVVNGELRGGVQTVTKYVTVGGERKKVLIITGIDPQRNWTPSPDEFLDGLEKGFWEIARRGGYDLVVVPALEFAQSSRRALLRTAFKRYREEIQIDEPVGFPKVGENPDGTPQYYHDVQHSDFLVFRSPPR